MSDGLELLDQPAQPRKPVRQPKDGDPPEVEAPVIVPNPEPKPWEIVGYQGPDVWDSQGRLISHPFNNQ